MRHYQIAVLPGDGIGPEVITESVQTLEALAQLHGGFRLETQHFDWGSERSLREGALLPQDGLAVLERGGFDGILLGPVGDPRVPDHLTLWGLLLPIRQGFDQYVNLRPMRLLPGVQSPLVGKGPAEIDMVCIRENTEGEYAGVGGRVHQLSLVGFSSSRLLSRMSLGLGVLLFANRKPRRPRFRHEAAQH
jgi:tartrate dehydrogenase/decarboxylase / D-malate dehydrogenase